MLALAVFWVAYVVQATTIVVSAGVTFWLRLSWLALTVSSFMLLQEAQPILHWTTREKSANIVWVCALLLSFASLLEVPYTVRVVVFFAYSSLQAGSVLYFLAVRSLLSLRD